MSGTHWTSSLCLHFCALVSFSNSKAATHLNKYVLDQKMYITKVTLDHILLYSKRLKSFLCKPWMHRGCWDRAPSTLKPDTRWSVVSFMAQLFYSQGKCPQHPEKRKLGGPHSHSGWPGKEKYLLPIGIKLCCLGRPVHSLGTILYWPPLYLVSDLNKLTVLEQPCKWVSVVQASNLKLFLKCLSLEKKV
jgi:hypothetical protein